MTKGKITAVILVVLVIVALFFALTFVPEEQEPTDDPNTETGTTTATTTDIISIGDGVNIEVPDGVIITPIPIDEPKDVIPQPELNRPVTIPDFFPEDAAKIMATKVADAITAVEEDPTSFDNWVTLGNLRGQIEDHEGAVEIYNYLGLVFPDNGISFLNAGTTYHLHLRDFEKAEENLQKARENQTTNILTYIALHELYRDSFKTETNLAEEVLLDGLTVVKNDPNLLIALAAYYENEGRTEEAKERYAEALAEAERIDNKGLIVRIEQALAELE